MPVPARSQSVKQPPRTGLPTRRPSTRLVKQNDENVDGRSDLQSILATSSSTAVLSQPSKDHQARGLPRPVSTRPPVLDKVRDVSASSITTKATRGNLTKPLSTISTTGPRPTGHVRQRSQAAASSQTLPPKAHVKTASTATVESDRSIPARSLRPRPQLRVGSQSAASTRIPNNDSSEPSGTPTARYEIPTITEGQLRDELFQLQQLYNVSSQVLSDFRASIQRNLSDRTQHVLHIERDILEVEQANDGALSIIALRQWLDGDAGYNDGEQIQLLAQVLRELHLLRRDGAAALQQFELWLSEASAIRDRRLDTDPVPRALKSVTSLGSRWRQDMLGLRDSLATVVKTMKGLGVANHDSGIDVVLGQHLRLAETMLQEVEIAQETENLIVQAERLWESQQLEDALKQLTIEADVRPDGESARQGLWTR